MVLHRSLTHSCSCSWLQHCCSQNMQSMYGHLHEVPVPIFINAVLQGCICSMSPVWLHPFLCVWHHPESSTIKLQLMWNIICI